MRSFLIVCLLSLCHLIFAQTYTVETVPNVQLNNARAFVSNPDHILSAPTVSTLDSMLYHLRQTNSSEFVVVALNSIGQADPRTFATALFEKWGIGRKEKDNGLLLLFVKDQRQALTEVGYGLEGILPDVINRRLMMKYMFPYFKEGNYDQGMIDGVRAFITYMTTDEANKELMVPPAKKENPIDWGTILFWYLIVSLLVGLFFIGSILSSLKNAYDNQDYSKYRAISSYKDFTLIFCFLFPITMLPLSLWLRAKLHRLRNKPQQCDHCGGKMHKLSEAEEDAYLSAAEQTEERINSIDYDVWLCDKCNKVKIFPYEKQYTKYNRCPVCHAKSYGLQSDKILVEPTTFAKGTGEKTYYCQHCHNTKKVRYLIPILAAGAIIGGGGGRGFGGGNFGGGGGGFGGGRSGGGGASIGW